MASLRADQKVGVIGAGTIGGGIAQIAAAAGHPVLLFDVRPDAAGQALQTTPPKVAEYGEDRYRGVSPLLRRKMFSGADFYE